MFSRIGSGQTVNFMVFNRNDKATDRAFLDPKANQDGKKPLSSKRSKSIIGKSDGNSNEIGKNDESR